MLREVLKLTFLTVPFVFLLLIVFVFLKNSEIVRACPASGPKSMRRLSLNPDLFLQVIKDVREIAHTYRRSVTSLPELQNRHPPETLSDAKSGE
jgi:hypothetical protein